MSCPPRQLKMASAIDFPTSSTSINVPNFLSLSGPAFVTSGVRTQLGWILDVNTLSAL